MAWAIRDDSGWTEIGGDGFSLPTLITPEEGDPYEDLIQFPANWLDLASEDERAAIGVVEIEEAGPAPVGMRLVGSRIEGEEHPRRVWLTEAIPLDEQRDTAKGRVNAGAGDFRRRFITDIPGQQATYLAKEIEAKAWTTGASAADFPYLAAEAAATGKSIAFIAALVLETATIWRTLDPKIEGKRRGAAVAIEAAQTAEAIMAAATVDWDALLA